MSRFPRVPQRRRALVLGAVLCAGLVAGSVEQALHPVAGGFWLLVGLSAPLFGFAAAVSAYRLARPLPNAPHVTVFGRSVPVNLLDFIVALATPVFAWGIAAHSVWPGIVSDSWFLLLLSLLSVVFGVSGAVQITWRSAAGRRAAPLHSRVHWWVWQGGPGRRGECPGEETCGSGRRGRLGSDPAALRRLSYLSLLPPSRDLTMSDMA